jgi:hypothetical protein
MGRENDFAVDWLAGRVGFELAVPLVFLTSRKVVTNSHGRGSLGRQRKRRASGDKNREKYDDQSYPEKEPGVSGVKP